MSRISRLGLALCALGLSLIGIVGNAAPAHAVISCHSGMSLAPDGLGLVGVRYKATNRGSCAGNPLKTAVTVVIDGTNGHTGPGAKACNGGVCQVSVSTFVNVAHLIAGPCMVATGTTAAYLGGPGNTYGTDTGQATRCDICPPGQVCKTESSASLPAE